MKAIFYSYSFFILANVLDILSSLGQHEGNAAMRDVNGIFCLHLSLEIKLAFLLYYLILSLGCYIVLRSANKTFASVLAALIPAYATYTVLGVAFDNILFRITGI